MIPTPTLSIIIPVYNIAAYLESAVRSVLAQTLTDFELILVDDGSTDGSGALCDRLAADDDRIRVIRQTHGGPSAARNTGIDAAVGEYIGFVDGDDWIEPDMYALLYENSVSYDADLSACGFIKIFSPAELQYCSENGSSQCLTPSEAMRAIFRRDHMRYSACNKLFRRDLFDGIRYPIGRLVEDKATIYRLIHRSCKIVWSPSPKYHYRMRSDSIMHTASVEKLSSLFQANEELIAFIAANYPELKSKAQASYAVECFRLLRQIDGSLSAEANARIRCIACIRRYWRQALSDPDAPIGMRLQLLLTALFCS